MIVIALVLAALIIQPVGAGEQTFDSEEFRSDLVAYFADLEQAYSHVVDAGGSPEPLDAIQGSQSLVAGMTGEAPTVFGPDAETTAPRAVGTESTSLLSHSCPEGHIGGLADEIALRASAITAQQAMEVLPTDTAGNVARVAFTVLWIIAEEELQAAEAKNALAEQCEQDNHRSILHNIVGPRVDIAVSTRATQTSVANIDADVAAHDTNIDSDLVAHNANIDSDLVAHNTNIDSDLSPTTTTSTLTWPPTTRISPLVSTRYADWSAELGRRWTRRWR